MPYFYSPNKEPGAGSPGDVWRMNGTKAYLKHYDQYLFLDFVTKNPRASEAEKRQARSELPLCEKAMTWWQRHPRYDQDEALRGVAALKKNWMAAA